MNQQDIEPRSTPADAGRRLAAVVLAIAIAAGIAAMAVVLYGVLEEKTQGGAPVFLALALVVLVGLSMPLISMAHKMWISGDARLRHAEQRRIALEREHLQTSREYNRRRREQQAATRARQPG